MVEDEVLVAMNLETMLEDLGCAVLGPAMRIDKAEAMVDNGLMADAAILDVNVGGREVFPLADRLGKHGVPVVFATGYATSDMPGEWRGWPVLQKPYTTEDVAHALRIALARG